ncbi:hypothetical protein SAMN05192568_10944 [Methylobacterium pseudosasicola]|uniref:Uncharacterized protein n=1 Tax=Methylobacterium pseudosasicola TaxID=582667 RepID=A0A1I4VCL9_9HYPH|nr:hypothetical protein SAMN05192568_10944 [Methylobacterium pseudosasicola]
MVWAYFLASLFVGIGGASTLFYFARRDAFGRAFVAFVISSSGFSGAYKVMSEAAPEYSQARAAVPAPQDPAKTKAPAAN